MNVKEDFLKNNGFDENNFNPLHKNKILSMDDIDKRYLEFIENFRVKSNYQSFCIKDIVGTNHPGYFNKAWIEAFFELKRADDIIEKYNRNPSYWTKDLKSPDENIAHHDTPLELIKIKGKYYIEGGNNRIITMMQKYFIELNQCKGEKEIEELNNKYVFYAEVKTLPEDKIINIANLLKKQQKDLELTFKNENEELLNCTIKTDVEEQFFDNNAAFSEYFKESFHKQTETKEDRIANVKNILYLYQDMKVLDESYASTIEDLWPGIKEFPEVFQTAKKKGVIDNNIFDIVHLNFETLNKKIEELIKTNVIDER